MGNLPYMGGAAVRTNVSNPSRPTLSPTRSRYAQFAIPSPPLPSCRPRRRLHIQRVSPLRAHPLAPRDGANRVPPLPHPVLLRRAGKTGCVLQCKCTSAVVRLCGGQPALVLILKPLFCANFLMAAPPLAGGATPIVRSDVVMRQLQVSCPFPVKCLCCTNGKALFPPLLHRRPEPRRDRRALHSPSVFLTGR